MNKTVSVLKLVRNEQLNHDNYLMVFQSDVPLSDIKPGQFLNILIPDATNTFLRRPFSFHDVDYTTNSFSVLVKALGHGTRKLTAAKAGDSFDIVFPLGNGFSYPVRDEKVLLIGGGVGIAPMMQLARESKELGVDVHILLGARTNSDHILIEQFEQFGDVYLTTNDGSLGVKGFVTNHPVLTEKNGFDRIYCCGPDAMMHAVAKQARAIDIECEVSLENMMACGFGVCLCCVTKTTEGNKCVCTEGPVFKTTDLSWQI